MLAEGAQLVFEELQRFFVARSLTCLDKHLKKHHIHLPFVPGRQTIFRLNLLQYCLTAPPSTSSSSWSSAASVATWTWR